MMQQLDTEKAQAVLFFGDNGVTKELLHSEFEALLDGYVPICEWQNEEKKAVYVEFNKDYIAVAAVFFNISFDAEGLVDPSWNLPLLDMARTVSKGPDLGAGPIHLACYSQCPVAYYRDWLWDPVLTGANGHFKLLQKALKRNRLGAQFKTTEEELPAAGGNWSEKDIKSFELKLSEKFSKQYEKQLKGQLEKLLSDQQMRTSASDSGKEQELKSLKLKNETDIKELKSLKLKHQTDIKELQLGFGKQIETLQNLLEERDAEVEDFKKRNVDLKTAIDGQVTKIEGLRDYYEHKLQRAKGAGQESLDSVNQRFEDDLDSKVTAATSELSELLKMKEVELSYRAEHEEQLRAEIATLKDESKELLQNSGDRLLEKLSEKGVNFVTYQPGAGHITIPLTEISRFVDNPNAFTADFCGVSEKHYLSWLKHYQTPVCSVVDDKGEMCCENVPRVVTPVEFVSGESDVCENHKDQKKTVSDQAV